MDDVIFVLLLTGAIGSGLIGGLFFAFSNFIMRAFDRLPPVQAIAAMQAINVTVLNRVFFLAFFGTAAISAGLCALAVPQLPQPGAQLMLVGALLYPVGSVLVTVVFNVPLNDRLAAVSLSGRDLDTSWQDYRRAWTAWNHVRTIASLAAAATLTICLWLR